MLGSFSESPTKQIWICKFAEENVRKYVEELLEAMAAAAGVEERERTLQAAATGLKTSGDSERHHVVVNDGRCLANLVCTPG